MELTIDQALQKAVEAQKVGRVQEADRLYTAILKAQPNHPDANHNLGILAVSIGKANEALSFLKTALEANPSIAQFWISYIDTLIRLDRDADAKAVFDQVKSEGAKGDEFDKLEKRLKQNVQKPKDPSKKLIELQRKQQNSLDLAIHLREKGQLNQAIDLLKEKINLAPEDADMLALLSHCYILSDQPEQARLYLCKAKKTAPYNASVGWNTARLLLKEKKPLDALHIARETIQRFPADIEGMGVLGACLRANGDDVESLNVLSRAIKLKPNYTEALINRGLIRLSQGHKPEALADLESAHRFQPHIKQIWDLVVGLKVEEQKYSEAVVFLNNMIEIDPNDEKRLATLGLCYQYLENFEASEEIYKKALVINPHYYEVHNNLGSALHEQGKLKEAIEAYRKALATKPDYAEAYYNMGNAFHEQGKLQEAIEVYRKAIAIKPDYAKSFNNMGNTLHEQGKPEEAIAAYKKALAIKPDYAEAYKNMGVTLKGQGKLKEEIRSYKKALAIEPDFTEAHRLLSTVTHYKSDNAQIREVRDSLNRIDLSDPDRCNLLYTYAKMSEDLGELRSAFDCYVAGGNLRKKLLGYQFLQDEQLFGQIKQSAPKFKDVFLSSIEKPSSLTPIFILGMPRSGTTLTEQIISSHSEVTGAGELDYVSLFGRQLTTGVTEPTLKALAFFRERYLEALAKRAFGQAVITDKMPQNFKHIGLICAALPEAKIIHVQRNSKATCWSNFKHYFALKGLGYSYNLDDIVKYHGLYKDLMHFWHQNYKDRIYNLDYDIFTEDQESKTRRLIEYLGLNWEDSCLAPQENRRSVRTASNQQVRQKVYKHSSQAWKKYEPFLEGVFDKLEE